MESFLRFLLLLPLLVGCSSKDESTSHKYEYDDVKDKQISYLDVFNVNSDKYYLYYYQVTCYHCHGIKSKVIQFAIDSYEPFYFVEVGEDYGFLSRSKEDTIGTNDPLKAFSTMTPQLSIVVDGFIIETYIGSEEIMNIIEY